MKKRVRMLWAVTVVPPLVATVPGCAGSPADLGHNFCYDLAVACSDLGPGAVSICADHGVYFNEELLLNKADLPTKEDVYTKEDVDARIEAGVLGQADAVAAMQAEAAA